MLQRIRAKIGTAGLVVAVVALVAAMTGGAYAASGALSGKQKKEVEKIAKKSQRSGPAGKDGANGTNGVNGKDGANGTNGKDGTNGAKGKSVSLTPIPVEEPECGERGGAWIKDEEGQEAEICTGEKGDPGAPGPEGTFGGGATLKAGVTERGAWAFNGTPADSEGVVTAITFPTRLAANLTKTQVHIFTEPNFEDFDGPGGEEEIGCEGNATNPVAPSGHLCIFGFLINATAGAPLSPPTTSEPPVPAPIAGLGNEGQGASKTGALLEFSIGPEAEPGYGVGGWAVTG